MGNCRSCDASRSTTVTAKLVLRDGRLQEFSWPVKVSLLLQQNPDCFICSSDEMEFDQYVAEMGGDEELQAGEVYFELPLRWRKQRLQAEDMAALAVKASVALSGSRRSQDRIMSRCGCCASGKIEPVVEVFGEKRIAAGDDGGGKRGNWKGGKLSAISEE
ncbi:UNVERIFIED_CONTAM: hypothetical protein Sradi_4690000 [Sesamum radiatum]|uniref:Uncharacterized protein n=1 Tax=Sesamum radiatum TaxID=300843 RepID=A0AAW2MXJ1_SESRA